MCAMRRIRKTDEPFWVATCCAHLIGMLDCHDRKVVLAEREGLQKHQFRALCIIQRYL